MDNSDDSKAMSQLEKLRALERVVARHEIKKDDSQDGDANNGVAVEVDRPHNNGKPAPKKTTNKKRTADKKKSAQQKSSNSKKQSEATVNPILNTDLKSLPEYEELEYRIDELEQQLEKLSGWIREELSGLRSNVNSNLDDGVSIEATGSAETEWDRSEEPLQPTTSNSNRNTTTTKTSSSKQKNEQTFASSEWERQKQEMLSKYGLGNTDDAEHDEANEQECTLSDELDLDLEAVDTSASLSTDEETVDQLEPDVEDADSDHPESNDASDEKAESLDEPSDLKPDVDDESNLDVAKLKEELQGQLRKAEVELSIQRAKLSQREADLEQKQAQLERRLANIEKSTSGSDKDKAEKHGMLRRLKQHLNFMGRKNDEEKET